MSIPGSDSNQISIHDMEWQGVTLSESAAQRVAMLTQQGQFFHLSIKPSGCTGFAYKVQLISHIGNDDLKFESHATPFYVALSAMPMLDGTELDYVRQGLNSNFVYNNPNVKNLCGCGESFGV